MTLVELLVVVTIAVILFATTVPLMKPALRSGSIREASRQLSVYFTGAKARAAALGQPVGVSIQRIQDGSNIGFELFMVETPPVYAGDVVGALALVSPTIVSGNRRHFVTFDSVDSASLAVTSSLALVQVNQYFLIKFDFRGPYYTCQRTSSGFELNVTNGIAPLGRQGADGAWGRAGIDDDSNGVTDDASESGWAGSDDVGVPYQILLPPKKSSVKPLQLSSGVCIDLGNSGYGLTGQEFDANISIANSTNPIVIGFGPGGDVDYVSVGGTLTVPTSTMHFLLATSDGVGTQAANATLSFSESIADLSSIWVSISPRTGLITSAENGWVEQTDLNSSLTKAREYATSGQSMGER